MKRRRSKPSDAGAQAVSITSDPSRPSAASNDIHVKSDSKSENIENFEITNRDPAKDLEAFQNICNEIRHFVQEIQELRSKGKDSTVCKLP